MQIHNVKINNNSLYHEILIKTFGRAEAIKLLRRSANSYTALDMPTYRKVIKYKARNKLIALHWGNK